MSEFVMNIPRIKNAIDRIEENTAALSWLRQYGGNLTNKDACSVHLRLAFASSCPGAKEAEKVISAFLKLSLAESVAVAIRNCENTIEMDRATIAKEAGRLALKESHE